MKNTPKPSDDIEQDELSKNWSLDYPPIPKNPKGLIRLAEEYPEKAGLQQLAQAYKAGQLF